jgi:hypothetical protein
MTIEVFRIQKGLDIDRQVQILYGPTTPVTIDADAAPVGSLFLSTTTGNLYSKVTPGVGIVHWQILEATPPPMTVTNVTSVTTIDAVLTNLAKWVIQIVVSADSTRVRAYEVFATHNGVVVSSDVYSSLNIGVAPAGLQITVALTGGDTLNLRVKSTTPVDVEAKRVSVF